MKTLIITFAVTALLFTLQIQETYADPEHNHGSEAVESPPASSYIESASCEDTINVRVNGLVCDFCARSLEKVFLKRGDVAEIKVDLNRGSVLVAMKPGSTIDDTTITRLIKDSGYNISAIERGCGDE